MLLLFQDSLSVCHKEMNRSTKRKKFVCTQCRRSIKNIQITRVPRIAHHAASETLHGTVVGNKESKNDNQESSSAATTTGVCFTARNVKRRITCMARNGVSVVSVVDLVVVMVGMVIVVQVIVVFDVGGMSVTDVAVLMLRSVRMGTGKELRVNMVGPLWKERSRAALCSPHTTSKC